MASSPAQTRPYDSPGVPAVASAEGPVLGPNPPPMGFPLGLLPPELRLMIWSCAAEPRIVLFNDLTRAPRSYAMPTVAQLNGEARYETCHGYERTCLGSYLHFSRDIVVCDFNIIDLPSDSILDGLARNVERLAFLDCAPDDTRVGVPQEYADYMSSWYRPKTVGKIDFDRFWFPNLSELWIIKIGNIDASWKVTSDHAAPYAERIRQQAREFRYWVEAGIIEMAQLDPDEANTVAILREGRCKLHNCHELNDGRNKIISKVNFIDGKYQKPMDGRHWVRINPNLASASREQDDRTVTNSLRWALVERAATFYLRWEDTEGTGIIRTRRSLMV